MPTNTWAAPHRTTPLDTTMSLPGSKSLTNRVLILSALADGPSVVAQPLRSRDTDLMSTALTALGVGIEHSDTALKITPPTWGEHREPAYVDCGLAGTVMRFVPPVAALVAGQVDLDGDDRARERPMDTIVSSLRSLGATIVDEGRGTLPFSVHGHGCVRGGLVTLDASASSQFVSALLLAGARYDNGIDIRHVGKPVPSMPHIDMTVAELRRRGVEVDDSDPNRWSVARGPIAALDCAVEPDLSNAGAFIAGALATGGQVRIRDWPAETQQAGDRWREIAGLFGARVTTIDGDLVVTAGDHLAGLHLDLHDEGELTPVVAALCALANGPSHLAGIGHLRGHETDRLAAIANEINRLGGNVTELDDGLTITPRPLHGGVFQTYADHRMAHAGVVLALATPGIEIVDIDTTAKTYPDFADAWTRFVS